MKKYIDEPGFFTMGDVKEVEKMNNITFAKAYAHEKVQAKPNARLGNISKAHQMIDQSRNIVSLMTGMSNFILSHESKEYKVLR